jgi:polyhydroxybutyrate depolymerase
MVRRLAVLLAAVLLAAACSTPSSAAPQGFTTGSTIHALSFGSAQQVERAYGWDQLADSAKFVVVRHASALAVLRRPLVLRLLCDCRETVI